MGQVDNLPENPGVEDAKTAQDLLSRLTQELESLQQNLMVQMNQDLKRLQTEKSRLEEEIEELQARAQHLKSQQLDSIFLSSNHHQQLATQELAQALALQLREFLNQRLEELAAQAHQDAIAANDRSLNALNAAQEQHQNAHRLLASLESTLSLTFQTLQQDLGSYQSSLSQQLSRMYNLEQQGEAILEALVNRLREQIRKESLVSQTVELEEPRSESPSSRVLPPTQRPNQLPASRSSPALPVKPSPVASSPQPPSAPKPTSQIQIGLVLAFLSAVVLSLFNVSLKILLRTSPEPRTILGMFQLQGLISPGFGNSLLILFLRMVVVMALMPILATLLYPPVWQDVRRFIQSQDRALMAKVVGSGFFLFLSQVFIYIAIGNIPTGIAITIFFIYPIVTVLASWGLFGDRPTLTRVIAMLVIGSGGILALPAGGVQGNFGVGVSAAIAAGVTFAGYVLLTQMGTKKLHPIPFTLIAFASIFVFCGLSLMLPLPPNMSVVVDPTVRTGLLIGGAILGVFTLVSYLLNNFAIRFAGAALASIIGTSGPALTALFGLLIIGETLKTQQWLGLGLVTLGVLGMSLERMFAPKKAT
ncbi:EamA family transporter [Desertifilum sp. FACHB-1129]|uniref:EamA domain-containing protein n=1 Tax=Desertifilum tharense IPPAS B-1220 TaxID=1781255 RepID=A0A1E5QJH3_9CYAN|nr:MULTISPECIES: DMT family transporter [Desertifilum]MDA0211504.1 EamA family transporter [Cyanobacteria bacterium FC1]MDI9639558.1 EamA family transporter [Geitlerinema splendidum]MDK3162354.1 EamA family transporter [Kamptonema cortianum]MDL5051656.1 EamA family transporter [Oscillatoria amoena NRMC-F 0135]MDL5052213.1 EamA family transporter [Oscillatoria laete-virens NRMC-F 0139]